MIYKRLITNMMIDRNVKLLWNIRVMQPVGQPESIVIRNVLTLERQVNIRSSAVRALARDP